MFTNLEIEINELSNKYDVYDGEEIAFSTHSLQEACEFVMGKQVVRKMYDWVD